MNTKSVSLLPLLLCLACAVCLFSSQAWAACTKQCKEVRFMLLGLGGVPVFECDRFNPHQCQEGLWVAGSVKGGTCDATQMPTQHWIYDPGRVVCSTSVLNGFLKSEAVECVNIDNEPTTTVLYQCSGHDYIVYGE